MASYAPATPNVERIVIFSRALRNSKVPVTPSETLDAAASLLYLDLQATDLLREGLRAVLVKRPEDYPIFDTLFAEYFGQVAQLFDQEHQKEMEGRINPSTPPAVTDHSNAGPMPPKSSETKHIGVTSASGKESELASKILSIYSSLETLGKKEFPPMKYDDIALLKRGIRRLARRTATRPGRRLAKSRAGAVDFQSTFRNSLASGGHLIELQRSKRKLSKSKLVILADISGSMDSHSEKLLKDLYYFCNTLSQTEVFAFSTRLVNVNSYLKAKSLRKAAEEVSNHLDFWSSGTRIGEALGELLSKYSQVLNPRSVLIVISDGWELGELGQLRKNLARIKSKVAMIVWLNPLADNPSYRPETLGMKTALPFIDHLSGLNILTDRREFERIFGKTIHAVSNNTALINRTFPLKI